MPRAMIVGARSQEAHLPWLSILLSSPTPLGAWWTGVPPDAGLVAGVGPNSVAMAGYDPAPADLDGLLHVGQSLLRRGFSPFNAA